MQAHTEHKVKVKNFGWVAIASMAGLVLSTIAFIFPSLGVIEVFEALNNIHGMPGEHSDEINKLSAELSNRVFELWFAFLVWTISLMFLSLDFVAHIAHGIKDTRIENFHVADTLNARLEAAQGEMRKGYKDAIRRVVSVVDFQRILADNPPVIDNLRALSKLYANRPPHQFTSHMISEAINDHLSANVSLHSISSKQFGIDEEATRMSVLSEVIAHSEQSVVAVTVDGGDYLERFWDVDLSSYDKYIEVNQQKAGKTRRCFVIGADVYNKENLRKFDIVNRLYDIHNKYGIGIKIIHKDDIPESIRKKLNFSFLISDDYITSRSYCYDAPNAITGSIKFGDSRELAELNSLYQAINRCRGRLWPPEIRRVPRASSGHAIVP